MYLVEVNIVSSQVFLAASLTPGGGALPIDFTGRLRSKGVPFSGCGYING